MHFITSNDNESIKQTVSSDMSWLDSNMDKNDPTCKQMMRVLLLRMTLQENDCSSMHKARRAQKIGNMHNLDYNFAIIIIH